MKSIKITVAYDGADFHGWQWQPGMPTIQGSLGEAAEQITQEKIMIFGASRTDAGVHAHGQVAHFKTRSTLTADDFRRALNALLPPQIRVVAAEEVGPDFHSRWNALAKTYRYRLFRGRVLPPFVYRRVLHYPWPLDEDAMARAARFFEGRHDFSSFAASSGSEDDDKDRDMMREIYRSEILSRPYDAASGGANGAAKVEGGGAESGKGIAGENDARILEYVVYGKSFLRYMVRKIVGTLLDVGKGKLKPEDIPLVFEMKDRSKSGMTVPPDGLYLMSLEYPDPTDSLRHTRPAAAREIG
jgi:tRNA pseudouridine38-40 synthase